MACRLGAGVEMLVKPAVARTVDAAGFPFHLDDLIAATGLKRMRAEFFGPEKNIARRLQTEQNGARTVKVRLVVAHCGPGRKVADQAIAGDFELRNAD